MRSKLERTKVENFSVKSLLLTESKCKSVRKRFGTKKKQFFEKYEPNHFVPVRKSRTKSPNTNRTTEFRTKNVVPRTEPNNIVPKFRTKITNHEPNQITSYQNLVPPYQFVPVQLFGSVRSSMNISICISGLVDYWNLNKSE